MFAGPVPNSAVSILKGFVTSSGTAEVFGVCDGCARSGVCRSAEPSLRQRKKSGWCNMPRFGLGVFVFGSGF